MIPLAGVLTVIFWGIVAALITILAAIARFYEITARQRSYYRWFIVPVILLLAGAVSYALQGDFRGDVLADALMLVGSAILIGLSAWLLHLMMGGRR
ncbi:MAG TPA: hypothetical protein VJG32_03460 [Anaerolineae bacterium]|nr:hypothetical protein [Anaerolineae bacterium]